MKWWLSCIGISRTHIPNRNTCNTCQYYKSSKWYYQNSFRFCTCLSCSACNYSSGRSYKSYKNVHTKEFWCQPYIWHSLIWYAISSWLSCSWFFTSSSWKNEVWKTLYILQRSWILQSYNLCWKRRPQSLQMHWPPNYKKPLCQNYIISNMIHFSAMVSYVLWLFLFSFLFWLWVLFYLAAIGLQHGL